MANRSQETSGLDDPTQDWLKRLVRVVPHPQWGVARVLRWFPASGGSGQRLRIQPANTRYPQTVLVRDVRVVKESKI